MSHRSCIEPLGIPFYGGKASPLYKESLLCGLRRLFFTLSLFRGGSSWQDMLLGIGFHNVKGN